MKLLLILGIIISSLAVLFFLDWLLVTMSLAHHKGARESFIEGGSGLLVSVIALIGCIALLRNKRSIK